MSFKVLILVALVAMVYAHEKKEYKILHGKVIEHKHEAEFGHKIHITHPVKEEHHHHHHEEPVHHESHHEEPEHHHTLHFKSSYGHEIKIKHPHVVSEHHEVVHHHHHH